MAPAEVLDKLMLFVFMLNGKSAGKLAHHVSLSRGEATFESLLIDVFRINRRSVARYLPKEVLDFPQIDLVTVASSWYQFDAQASMDPVALHEGVRPFGTVTYDLQLPLPEVSEPASVTTPAPKDAFLEMMRREHFPASPKNSTGNKRLELRSAIVCFLKENNYYTRSQDSAEKLLDLLDEMIWVHYSLPTHLKQEKLLEDLHKFYEAKYFDAKGAKKSTASPSSGKIFTALQSHIADVINLPNIQKSDGMTRLITVLKSYWDALNRRISALELDLERKSKANSGDITAIRSVNTSNPVCGVVLPSTAQGRGKGNFSIDKSPFNESVANAMFEAVANREPYDPVCITSLVEFHGWNEQTVEKLAKYAPFPVGYGVWRTGNYRGHIIFLYKASDPVDFNRRSFAEYTIRELCPKYVARGFRRKWMEEHAKVDGIDTQLLKGIFGELTKDQSAESLNAVRRILTTVGIEEDDLMQDVKEEISADREKRPSKYENFFLKTVEYLNECNMMAVDNRRHGTTLFKAVPTSLRALRQEIISKYNFSPDAVPSESYLALQFIPSKKNSHTRYLSRIEMKYVLQQRTGRHFHEDVYYQNKAFMYLRTFAVLYREHCTLLYGDDKTGIPVGDPGVAQQAVVRQRRVMTMQNADGAHGCAASDHDFHTLTVTPSVWMAADIPNDIGDSWYQGQIHLFLKDAIFQSSNAARHGAELMSLPCMRRDVIKPILLIYTDGGPDHRARNISTLMSAIAIFITAELDHLCLMNTAPYHSYSNPAERAMCVLNYALYGIALERRRFDDDDEALLANLQSRVSIRGAAQSNGRVREIISEATEEVISSLRPRFESLLYADHSVKTMDAPAQETVASFVPEAIQKIDASIKKEDLEQLGKKDLPKYKLLHGWIEKHVDWQHYCIQIRKCADPSCCQPPRLAHLHSTVPWVPLPLKDPGNPAKYLSYESVAKAGERPLGDDRPSAARKKTVPTAEASYHVQGAAEHDRECRDMMLSFARVRATISCTLCGKKRGVYSAYRLSDTAKPDVIASLEKESPNYSCGQPWEFGTKASGEYVTVRYLLTCSDPMETPVHQHLMRSNKIHCFCCGEENAPGLPKEKKPKSKEVVCTSCEQATSKTEKDQSAKGRIRTTIVKESQLLAGPVKDTPSKENEEVAEGDNNTDNVGETEVVHIDSNKEPRPLQYGPHQSTPNGRRGYYGSIQLIEDDFLRVEQHRRWISANLIYLFVRLMRNHLGASTDAVHFIDSLFLPRLHTDGISNKNDYMSANHICWTKPLWLVLGHVASGTHWNLTVVSNPIALLDSTRGDAKLIRLDSLPQYRGREYVAQAFRCFEQASHHPSIRWIDVESPEQKDGYSCGTYVMAFVYRIMKDVVSVGIDAALLKWQSHGYFVHHCLREPNAFIRGVLATALNMVLQGQDPTPCMNVLDHYQK